MFLKNINVGTVKDVRVPYCLSCFVLVTHRNINTSFVKLWQDLLYHDVFIQTIIALCQVISVYKQAADIIIWL